MRVFFADTFYFLALLNERDDAHRKAVDASRRPGLRVVTTEYVMLELADALCEPHQREEVLALWGVVERDSAFTLVHASKELTDRGRDLYRNRPDKDWPLTDCISFVVMRDFGLSEALTADRHFEQAGFKALLA